MRPKLQKGHWFILYVMDEMTNYLINTPLYQARSEEVGKALIENIVIKFGMPDYMMMDQDSAFMSSLTSYLFRKLGITIKTVGPYNHKSLQTEHGIKSLSSIVSKHLTDQGQRLQKFLSLATFAYNIFHILNLGNHPPYELMFGRKPKLLIYIETNPDIKISGMFKDYHTLLTKRLDYLQKTLQNFKNEAIGTFKQGQGVFPMQQWRFGLYNISLNISVENIFKKVWCQLCRSLGSIQNCRSAQLPIHDYRGATDERIV